MFRHPLDVVIEDGLGLSGGVARPLAESAALSTLPAARGFSSCFIVIAGEGAEVLVVDGVFEERPVLGRARGIGVDIGMRLQVARVGGVVWRGGVVVDSARNTTAD